MVTTQKRALRADVLRRRAGLTPEQLDATAQALRDAAVVAVADAVRAGARGPVAAYASLGTEPGTGPLRAALRAEGTTVLLPVLQPDGDLDWAVDEGDLRPGLRGTLEPPRPVLGRNAVAACAVVVVPALAVDRAGTRLGRGGGAYDRALARATGRVLAALHEGELVEALPVEPHDRPVHAALVPGRGTVRLRPHPADGVVLPPGEMEA